MRSSSLPAHLNTPNSLTPTPLHPKTSTHSHRKNHKNYAYSAPRSKRPLDERHKPSINKDRPPTKAILYRQIIDSYLTRRPVTPNTPKNRMRMKSQFRNSLEPVGEHEPIQIRCKSKSLSKSSHYERQKDRKSHKRMSPVAKTNMLGERTLGENSDSSLGRRLPTIEEIKIISDHSVRQRKRIKRSSTLFLEAVKRQGIQPALRSSFYNKSKSPGSRNQEMDASESPRSFNWSESNKRQEFPSFAPNWGSQGNYYFKILKDEEEPSSGNRTAWRGNRGMLRKKYRESQSGKKMEKTVDSILGLGVPALWQIRSSNRDNKFWFAPMKSPLRHELFSYVEVKQQQGQQWIRIIPRQEYHELFYNKSEFFVDIIKALVRQLIMIQGRAICNKIDLDNLFRLGEKDIRVGSWDSSALRRKIQIAGQHIELKDEPLLSDGEGWLINPESLPPEVVQLLLEHRYEQVWSSSPQAQVWSVGLVIFEILFMVPVWMPKRAISCRKTAQRGLFYAPNRSLSGILEAQRKTTAVLGKMLRQQKEWVSKASPVLIQLMKQCLQINQKRRPSLKAIWDRLQMQ